MIGSIFKSCLNTWFWFSRLQRVFFLKFFAIFNYFLRNIFCTVFICDCCFFGYYCFAISILLNTYTVFVVVLTDFAIPGILPPPLVELLEKLVNPLPILPPKKSSSSNIDLPKPIPPKPPNPPKLPKPPPAPFFLFDFPKKLLKKGSSSNSWLLKNFEKRSLASLKLKWWKEVPLGPSNP